MQKDHLQYGKIMLDAWQVSISNKRIWKFGTITIFFLMFVDTIRLSYQFYSTYYHLIENSSFLATLIDFASELFRQDINTFFLLTFALVFLLLGFLFFPTFCYGVIVKAVVDSYQKKDVKLLPTIMFSLGRFNKIWELDAILSILSLMEIITISLFIFNNLAIDIFKLFSPILIIAGIISIVMSVISPFAYQYIIIDKLNIAESLQKSYQIVINNFKDIIFLMIVGIIIFFRLIVEVVLFTTIPGLILSFMTFIASHFTFLDPQIMMYIGVGLSFLFILFLAKVFGIIYIFTTSLWTIAWLELKDEKINDLPK